MAAIPTRGTNVTVQLGLVNVPITVFKATEDQKSVPTRSQFVEVGGEMHQVGSKPYDKITQEYVDSADVVKRVVLGEQLVELTDEEIADLTVDGPARGVAPIEALIPLHLIGTRYVVESMDFARPQTVKVKGSTQRIADPNTEKAFMLILAALEQRQCAALLCYTGGRSPAAKYAALMPDGRVAQLVFDAEVREQPDMPVPSHTDAELGLAFMLLDAIGESEPDLVDDAGGKIAAYLSAKVAGAAPVAKSEPTAAPVIDLTAALAASLEAAGGKTPAKKGRRTA